MSTAAKLLKWYRQHGRDLPWRHTRNPYNILVSEIMLQQTQVERVKIFYRTWLKQFPNWKRLAQASNADVIKAWSGLGYNRRALALRDIARQVKKHGVPQTQEAWMDIKGIGPYTSAALSAFAQHKRVMPIDTNIRRVLGRLLLAKPFPQQKDDVTITQKAEDFLPTQGTFYDVPQAIFDLATMICTKKPDCARCPLRSVCPLAQRFQSGDIPIPKRSIKKTQERRHRNKKHPDRIYRGRILKLVKEQGSVGIKVIGQQIDDTFDTPLDTVWLEHMIKRLCQDRLLKKNRSTITLPV